jgi:hypothetical protein
MIGLLMLSNAVVTGLLATKFLRDGFRGTRTGWNPPFMRASRPVNLPVPMSLRERYCVNGAGALCAASSVLNLTEFLVRTLRR